MDDVAYRYNTALDARLRSIGIWPYFATYGLLALIFLVLGAPAPFHSPLLDRSGVAGAVVWAFFGSYPVFHIFMKPRLFPSYRGTIPQATGIFIGLVIVLTIVPPLFADLPEDLSRRARRLLMEPISVFVLLIFVSTTLSMGVFLLLEPLRERVWRLLVSRR